jgi:hypothetical protein
MKRTLFLLLILLVISNTYSQNLQINFAGTGVSTKVDSVKVENLTQGTFLTIQGVDVLHLAGNTGINSITYNEGIAIVNPNPMTGHAVLTFYVKQSGKCQIIIYDITGKNVIQMNDILLFGTHKYELNGLKDGAYFIYINGEN